CNLARDQTFKSLLLALAGYSRCVEKGDSIQWWCIYINFEKQCLEPPSMLKGQLFKSLNEEIPYC
ncbi:MAG: hypothetical protein ACR2O0_02030, partial [Rhizobiaceae bacterium]